VGTPSSALQLIAALLARTDLPPGSAAPCRPRAPIGPRRQTPACSKPARAPTCRWDNNLLGAPNLSSLTLTFPTEAIQLLLDESNRPCPGSYQRADLRLDHTLVQSGGTRWDIGLALLQRHSAAVPEVYPPTGGPVERSQGAHYPPPAAPG
jgi:hypothetical protein